MCECSGFFSSSSGRPSPRSDSCGGSVWVMPRPFPTHTVGLFYFASSVYLLAMTCLPQKLINHFKAVSSMCMLASQAVRSRMQLALHATHRTSHGASRLVQAMSTWSARTRRAPSRQCRGARVYGHTTTAMHDMKWPHRKTSGHARHEVATSENK